MKTFMTAVALLLLSSLSIAQPLENCEVPIDIKVEGKVLSACLNNSDTAKAFLAKLPISVVMSNAHDIEMVHRFEEPLPAQEARRSSFAIGDIFYWTPRHALVIYYDVNGKQFDCLQKVGHISSSVDFLRKVKQTEVTFKCIDCNF